MWQRDTPWRQGHVLRAASVKALGLEHPEAPDDTVVLVISHDCDLAAAPDAEPHCEVIIGKPTDAVDGSLANAKSPRRLHIEFSGGVTHLIGEFVATSKKEVSKALLADHEPATSVRMTDSDLRILRTWLANRYDRSAFSDTFDNRFKHAPNSFYQKFSKIIKKTENHLLAVYFKVTEPVLPEEPHVLDIYLLYRVDGDPTKAETIAATAAETIETLCKRTFQADGKWHDVELRDCEIMSEDAISVYQARQLQKWEFDHLSVAPEIGEAPMQVA